MDLDDVVCKISRELVNQEHEIYADIESQRIRIQHNFRIPFLENILGKVSFHALNLIKKQHDEAVRHARSVSSPIGCTGELVRTMGLPCEHLIARCLLNGRKVEMADIHPQWRLRSRSNADPLLTSTESSLPPTIGSEIRNPLVQMTRGRPVGRLNRSGIIGTRKDPSGFEYVLNEEMQEAGHVQYAEVKATIANVVPKSSNGCISVSLHFSSIS